jgi:hypothetical protein
VLPAIDPDTRDRYVALRAKADRGLRQADALKPLLPGQLASPDDIRAFTVWWAAHERGWAAHKDAMELIFGELEDDGEALRAARAADLDELGRRVKQFADFCDLEIAPRLDRLEKGLKLLEGTPTHPERERWLQALSGLRQKVREALPVAWTLSSPAAHLYRLLPPASREEAERRWGPLTGTDPHDFSPMWRTHFPSARLAAVDRHLEELTNG